MIRFIFVVLFVVLFLILSTPLMLVEWIIGKFNPGLKDRSSLAIVNWAFRWVIRLSGTKVETDGYMLPWYVYWMKFLLTRNTVRTISMIS